MPASAPAPAPTPSPDMRRHFGRMPLCQVKPRYKKEGKCASANPGGRGGPRCTPVVSTVAPSYSKKVVAITSLYSSS
eukprot:scaffold9733_cov108-Isochrysis_galbana.AAC.4